MKKLILIFFLLISIQAKAGTKTFFPHNVSYDDFTVNGNVLLNETSTALNLYVSTTGSDSNDCSSTAKCLTIQKALDKVAGGLVTGNVTVYVADGTYAENLYFPSFLGASKDTNYGNRLITIQGNDTTPANVKIKPASSTIIRLYDTIAKFSGVSIEGSSSSSTQGGIVTFRSKVYWKNTQFRNVGTFIQLNEMSDGVYESGSTTGLTWTGAGNGILLSVNTNSRMTLSSSATLTGGSGTTTMLSCTANSRCTTGSSTTFNLYGGAATHTGITASSSSAIAIGGALRIEDITAANTIYDTAAIRLNINSSYFQTGATILVVDNVKNVLYGTQSSSFMASSTGVVGTYTNISGNFIEFDHSVMLDAVDYFDPPASSGLNWDAVRTAGNELLREPIYNGPTISASSTLELDSGSNYNNVTGTTTINRITTTDLYSDLQLLQFDSSVTITNDASAVGTSKPIRLTGAANFAATANDLLVLFYDRNNSVWREITRSVR